MVVPGMDIDAIAGKISTTLLRESEFSPLRNLASLPSFLEEASPLASA